jgi:hypothetical protein
MDRAVLIGLLICYGVLLVSPTLRMLVSGVRVLKRPRLESGRDGRRSQSRALGDDVFEREFSA